jgi:hypothetical protein
MTHPKLLSSGVYGCVYYPGYMCTGEIDTTTDVTKLVIDDFTAQSEIDVGQILKNIEGFNVVTDNCTIKHKVLQTSGLMQQCDLLKYEFDTATKYKIMHSPYINSVELDAYLNKQATSDIIIRTYIRICELIAIMISKQVVHNDLHFGNILVNNSINLYIIDYGLDKCYTGDLINYPYLKSVTFKYMPSWKYWTIEYHIICFLLHSKHMFTEVALNKLINDYVLKHSILKSIGFNFLEEFLKTAKEYFKQYVGQSKDVIIKSMLQSYSSWDYYKIGLHYISIYTTNKLQHEEFLMIILLLIHPNPTFRPSVSEIEEHNKMLIMEYKPEHVSPVVISSKLRKSLVSSVI